MRWVAVLILACLSAFARAAEPPPPLPPGIGVPAEIQEEASRRQYWSFSAAQFDFLAPGARETTHRTVEGRLWHLAVKLATPQKMDPDSFVALLADRFAADGWTVLRRQGAFVARKPQQAGELWLSGAGNAGWFPLVLVQASPPPRQIAAAAPAPQPETIDDRKDFPYAPPFPGAVLQRTAHDARPFEIVLPGGASSYATPFATKWYAEPHDVSSYEFVVTYRAALQSVGWDVVRGAVAGDAVVIAHYARNGRDLWLYTRGDGSQQFIAVADFGADAQSTKLRRQLAAAGHVALYGIYFDTDLATPRPESETTLQQVLALLTQDPALRLEVQGHTDSTGSVQHNEALSAARAASVVAWLTAHAIDAARLTGKGYAASVPVADNRTPEGRAKNRRVELARP
jgi:outer membrane protein OmpA-like peptidoglycan-associated protein